MDGGTAPKFVGIKEAAEFLGVSYSVVWESLRRGDFPVPSVQIGTKWRISRPGLEALAGQLATKSSAEPTERLRRRKLNGDPAAQRRRARRRLDGRGD